MKKIFTTLLMSLCSLSLLAQKDVTKFLGIPIDGLKSEMRKKIISKGFTPKQVIGEEYYEGEFNGTDVRVTIVTNNNKVYRIMISDANTIDETNIRIRFNRLVRQFEKNKRYISLNDNFTIPEDEDISYEMAIKNKNYEALFYQYPDPEIWDSLAFRNQIQEEIKKRYTAEEIANPTKELEEEFGKIGLKVTMDLLSKKVVWFRICELYGKYYIVMYYDNEYNHADGEDL